MITAYIGLGSNLGDPIQQIHSALGFLMQLPASEFIECSSLYGSKPWGDIQDQPDFVNAVAQVDTELSPYELLDELQRIEKEHKRDRSKPRGSARTLDLDLLIFGQAEINSPQLVIPHLYLKQRAFVVYPLAEIAPNLVLPDGETIKALCEQCSRDELSVLEYA